MKYKVKIWEKNWVQYCYEVEADNPEEAKEKAIEGEYEESYDTGENQGCEGEIDEENIEITEVN